MGLRASPAPGRPRPPVPTLLFPRPRLVPSSAQGGCSPPGAGGGPGGPADSLCRPDVAVQVQPHGSHSKVLQAAPPAGKLPLHLPSPGPITGVLRGGVRWGGVGGSPPQAQSAHLIVQAQEAQGIANTLHLVQDAGAQHHGCEGDVDGAFLRNLILTALSTSKIDVSHCIHCRLADSRGEFAGPTHSSSPPAPACPRDSI